MCFVARGIVVRVGVTWMPISAVQLHGHKQPAHILERRSSNVTRRIGLAVNGPC